MLCNPVNECCTFIPDRESLVTTTFFVRADVRAAEYIEKMVTPRKIQMTAKIRAMYDLGALSPYLQTRIDNNK